MIKKYVNTRGLNFRSEPRVVEDTKITTLHLGQSVEIIGQADRPGWLTAEIQLNGNTQSGFISEKFLRVPVSKEREQLIFQAIAEWERFELGLGKETQDPYFKFVGEMWRAIGMDLDGRDTDVPWSAAAISFMIRNAGEKIPSSKYSKFRFAAAHARYINDSISRRDGNDQDTPFWGFRLGERKPQLGDLVCRARAGQSLTFDFARNTGFFKSHCDLIVGMSDEKVLTIGGNVGNSVRVTEYDLTPSGFLDDTNEVFMFLGNTHP